MKEKSFFFIRLKTKKNKSFDTQLFRVVIFLKITNQKLLDGGGKKKKREKKEKYIISVILANYVSYCWQRSLTLALWKKYCLSKSVSIS